MDSQPGRFEFLMHTADAKFRAYGKTLEECFRNAAVATFEIIAETAKIKDAEKFAIAVDAKRLDSLLFDYIDALLFLLDTEGLVVCDVEGLKIEVRDGHYYLTGTAVGDHHKGYDVSGNIKAVTYNEMYLKETENGWECQVVVDL